jgi:hypothetical protein
MATGVNVSKGNLYGALSPPQGVGVSKANLYAVISLQTGVLVSKANLYAALAPASSGVVVGLPIQFIIL